jgi:hypothetical protein
MKRLIVATLTIIPIALASMLAVAASPDAAPDTAAAPAKMTICHKTGSATNPWRRISVSSRAMSNPSSRSGKTMRGHLRHNGDAVVTGTAACPPANATPSPTSTPATKVTICHKTGSTTNPYRRITVSSRALSNPNSSAARTLRGHMGGHAGDIALAGATACPSGTPSQQQGVKLSANLRPVPGASGSGSTAVTIRVGQSTLCYTLSVTGLTNVTAAHIHRVSTGAIVVPLTAPTTGTSSGCVTVERALLREIVANPAAFYVNVHTSTHEGGQVQGTLSR